MADDRFKLFQSNEIKNKRGRKWVDVSDNVDSDSDASESQYSEEPVAYSSDESYVEFDENDCSDVDFDELVKDSEVTNESTNRLAVLHFDFDEYSLAYLALIIKSELPKTGKIKSITKYPTKEYMDRYDEDLRLGPKEYRGEVGEGTEDGQGEGEEREEDGEEEGERDKALRKLERLKSIRKYQISRLKFFVAVFEFDSIATADAIYESLNDTNIGDSGLKLDLRYVDPQRTFDDIGDRFLHLVEKLRPNSSKWSSTGKAGSKAVLGSAGGGFRPSCFAEINVKEKWDANRRDREDFVRRAMVESDGDLEDVEEYFCEDTITDVEEEYEKEDENEDYEEEGEESEGDDGGESEEDQDEEEEEKEEVLVSDEESEIEEFNEEEEEQGRFGKILSVQEIRSRLGLASEIEEECESEEDEEDDEEEMQVESDDHEKESESFQEEYVIDEAAMLDDDEEDEEDDDNGDSEEGDKSQESNDEGSGFKKQKKIKKMSQRDKMKSILKEKAEKRNLKINETRQLMKSVAQEDDRFDEFLFHAKQFKITQTHPKYEDGKFFLEMMKQRAELLEVKADFVIPNMEVEKINGSRNQDSAGPMRKRRRIK